MPLSYGVCPLAHCLKRRHSFSVVDEEQSQQYDDSLQRKAHREHDPHSDRLLTSSSRFESPLFDRFHSGKIEILVSGRALHQDILDFACVTYVNFQQGRALEALSSRRLWVAGFDLVPAQRAGNTIAS